MSARADDSMRTSVCGRLAVEQRIIGMLALLGLLHYGLLTIWLALALGTEGLAPLYETRAPLWIILGALAALLVNLAQVSLRMPTVRWPRADGERGPSPLPLALAGAPSLLLWPLLIARDRRARATPASEQEIEPAFRELLALPRVAMLGFATTHAAATLVIVLIVTQTLGGVGALTSALGLSSLLVSSSVVASRTRAMLLPEYLGAPRPDPLGVPMRDSLVVRLGTPAGLAVLGAVLIPSLVGSLWVGSTLSLTSFAIVALGLISGFATLALLLRDVERDLGRASRQISAVADGEIPEPMAIETFATAELRHLVAAVDHLVGRITDANVYKYVLIEKGHEADRLKSQFLANMSHDLRSPLNSVIGFSELLSTGIEGELAPDQLEMVGTIHRTGKDLLQQIDDILDTAKIEAGRMELHREPTPPATLISRAIQRARLRVAKPIDFDTTFAAGVPPAFVDPYRTTQALENVLLFAAEGLQQGTIEISCEAKRDAHGGRSIVIRIASPRALVPISELEQARRGFFRLPGHTGLGLGLPIATAILEAQGGSLSIEDGSSNSLGARAAMGFELRVPALAARKLPRLRV